MVRVVATLILVGLIGLVALVLLVVLQPSTETPDSGTSSDSVIFVGAGDIAECPTTGDEETAEILDRLVAEDPDTVVYTTGDNAYPDGSYDQYLECYHPSWGRHKDRTHPAVGNHDFRQRMAEGYHRYWGDAGGPFDLYYYSFDVADWHVVVLNSECHRVGCEFDSDDGEQVEWLEADLAASDASCTIGIWHAPRWSSGRYGSDPDYSTFWEVLYDHGAEVVLNGHEHLYERFEPMAPDGSVDRERGIRQFTVGTGGGNLRDFPDLAPNSAARGLDHGVLQLSLGDGRFDWKFLAVDGASFTDEGSGSCH